MTLNDAQRAALLQMLNSTGYQVLLDLGNDECEKLVTELLSIDTSEDKKVLSKHNGARFARLYFDRLCVRAEIEAKLILKPEENTPLPLDFIREVDSKTELPDDFIPEEWSGRKGPVITG